MKTATLHQSLQAKLGAYTGEHLTAAIRLHDGDVARRQDMLALAGQAEREDR